MRKKMWHCKNCGRVCDSSNSVCPDCGLDLGFYGEIQFIETGESSPSSPIVPQPQTQAEPAAEAVSRPEMKKEHKVKEHRPEKEGKRSIALIVTVAVLSVLLLLERVYKLEDIRKSGMSLFRQFYIFSSLSSLLEMAKGICLAVALLIVAVKAAKRSRLIEEDKRSKVLILTVVVVQALLVLEHNLVWLSNIQINNGRPLMPRWFYAYVNSTSSFRPLLLLAAGIYLVVALVILVVQAAKGSGSEKADKRSIALIVPVVVLHALLLWQCIMTVLYNTKIMSVDQYRAYFSSPFYSLVWAAIRICLAAALLISMVQAAKQSKPEKEDKSSTALIAAVVLLPALLLTL